VAAARNQSGGVLKRFLRGAPGGPAGAPDEFISIWRETGAIHRGGRMGVREACRQVLHGALVRAIRSCVASVKLSSRSLQEAALTESAFRVLEDYRLSATALVFFSFVVFCGGFFFVVWRSRKPWLMQDGPETLATLP